MSSPVSVTHDNLRIPSGRHKTSKLKIASFATFDPPCVGLASCRASGLEPACERAAGLVYPAPGPPFRLVAAIIRQHRARRCPRVGGSANEARSAIDNERIDAERQQAPLQVHRIFGPSLLAVVRAREPPASVAASFFELADESGIALEHDAIVSKADMRIRGNLPHNRLVPPLV